MAKSKSRYPKKKNYQHNTSKIKQTNNNNLGKPNENKNVYTQEYLEYKKQQESQRPLFMRILGIALVCIMIIGFVISPLLY